MSTICRRCLFTLAVSAIVSGVFLPATARSDDWGKLVKNGGLRVEDSSGRPLIRFNDEEALIPASIFKIATAFCALEELGRSYRFETPFFTDGSGTLYVRGSGDPSLVSEELERLAKALAPRVKRVEAIVVDTALFAPDITIDGASASTNPYDARNAAFVGNFSTAMLTRLSNGSVVSAEPQTPLTPLSRAAGERIRRGATERINLGTDWRVGARYGGELLAAKLTAAGVLGEKKISLGPVPTSATPLYTHRSSQTLEEIARGLLEFSTNFTANQVFLTIGLEKFGAPATLEKGQRAVSSCLQKRVGWQNFHAEEGSGLSRKTKVSAHMMTMLLEKFRPYAELLKREDGFTAKTGTLTGVNTLAGYFTVPNRGEVRFAILVNAPVEHSYKYAVARRVRDALVRDAAR